LAFSYGSILGLGGGEKGRTGFWASGLAMSVFWNPVT
jgi:hypothetical protein